MGRLSIHLHPDGRGAVHAGGFSWLAAVALPVWLLRRGLYRTFAVATPALFALHEFVGKALEQLSDDMTRGLAGLAWVVGVSLLFGSIASRWHLRVLRRSGYVLSAIEPERRS